MSPEAKQPIDPKKVLKSANHLGQFIFIAELFLQILVPIIVLALIIGIVFSLIRSFQPSGGSGDFSGLQVIEEDAIIYLTFYYPGHKGAVKDINGGCVFSIESHVYYRNSSGQVIDTCSANSGQLISAQQDNSYHIATKFNGDNYGWGGLAANYRQAWREGGLYDFTDPARALNGTTYWISFPNLDGVSSVPVVSHYGTDGRVLNQNRDGINGFQGSHAFDFAVKEAEDEANIRRKICTRNINVPDQAGNNKDYCVVEGATVYFGNPFISSVIVNNPLTERLIEIARGELGVNEAQNMSRIRTYLLNAGITDDSQPWCASFATWVAKQAGSKIPGLSSTSNAGVNSVLGYFRSIGTARRNNPKRGDFFMAEGQHTGIIESVNDDGSFQTIEGNIGNKVTSRKLRGPSKNGEYTYGGSPLWFGTLTE